jgi:hypothetical protein
MLTTTILGAAGYALIGTLITGGGIGTFIILFLVFKMLGK